MTCDSDVINAGLQPHPTTIIFLAFQNKNAGGIATCFGGFSTIAARPLSSIHDFYIIPELRSREIGHKTMAAVDQKGCDTGCCKITLEVQQNNHRARRIYEADGFSRAVSVEAAAIALFLSRPL